MTSVFLAFMGLVKTRFYDDLHNLIGESAGTRQVTPENIKEARDQGYRGTDEEVCWKSLVDHELLHTIICRQLYNEESRVLLHEAGLLDCPYVNRLWEEVLVLSSQYYVNKGNWQVGAASLALSRRMEDIIEQLIMERKAAGIK